MSCCDNCFIAVTHEGKPEGKIEKIGGIECYVATPTIPHPVERVVLLLTDIFGLAGQNNRLLPDDFARNGFKTIVPDLFSGDPILVEPPPNFDRDKWSASHGPEQTRPIIDKVVAGLKEGGVVGIAGTGYCFGARYVFDLAFDGILKVSVVSHPSRLVIPDDLKKYATVSKAPLLINSCEVDKPFPLEAQAQADEILGGGKFAPGYRREYFAGCSHGFAVRGDMSDPLVKAGKEGAFKASVEWITQYL
ncbi:dienelactone hydrolase endo-1,3,1,4-beta-D-glucanase [Favolaschia claudopus]|uniref:Dienelactone hydrolase endo-1,3,1,4-beta-D-glucanase n=1 Tax=Favolaschia claudopus TaxID=2862362 RepID=A0AAW0CMS5_9AGAR